MHAYILHQHSAVPHMSHYAWFLYETHGIAHAFKGKCVLSLSGNHAHVEIEFEFKEFNSPRPKIHT